MMPTGDANHAPVADFRLDVAGDRIVGHAAPAGGHRPCLLRLEAAGVPIAYARAGRYSAEAAASGLRLGWCGVTLPGLRLAAAIGARFTVRCALTGRPLLRAATPPPSIAVETTPLTVPALLAHSRRAEACDDPAQILPFAVATQHRHGLPAFLSAAYRTFLRRDVEPELVGGWTAVPPVEPVAAALRMILTSAEYLDDPFRFIPGPFHPAFAFDLAPFDA